MRKAAIGALLLGLFALATMWPLSTIAWIHLLSLAGLAAFYLLSVDPPAADVRQYRAYLIAAAVAGLAAFVFVQLTPGQETSPLRAVARGLAVAVVALPLWIPARWERYIFVAAAAVALATGLVDRLDLIRTMTIPASGLTAAAAALVAFRLDGRSFTASRKAPRQVVASNIVVPTPEEKARRLAQIEARFAAGEIPEHKYWDVKQELESR